MLPSLASKLGKLLLGPFACARGLGGPGLEEGNTGWGMGAPFSGRMWGNRQSSLRNHKKYKHTCDQQTKRTRLTRSCTFLRGRTDKVAYER